MSSAAIQALKGLQGRAKTGIISSATQGYWLRFERWKMLHKGVTDALAVLTDDNLALRLSNSYLPPSHLQAAWSALPVNADELTLSEVVDLCRSKGVRVAEDRVSKANLSTFAKLIHDEAVSGLADIDDEQTSDCVDSRDGSSDLHKSLPDVVDRAILPSGEDRQEGGAA